MRIDHCNVISYSELKAQFIPFSIYFLMDQIIPIYPSMHLSMYLSISFTHYLYSCLSTYLSIYLYLNQSINLSIFK